MWKWHPKTALRTELMLQRKHPQWIIDEPEADSALAALIHREPQAILELLRKSELNDRSALRQPLRQFSAAQQLAGGVS